MALSHNDRVSSAQLGACATGIKEYVESNYANKFNVVDKDNDQYIAGQKTFNADPIVQNTDTTQSSKVILVKSNGTDNENIQLRYDTDGNRGLYDNYNQDWMVKCGTDNVPKLNGLADKATKDGVGDTITTKYLTNTNANLNYVKKNTIVTEVSAASDDSHIPTAKAVMSAINNIDANGTYLQTGSNIDTMHAADDSLISSGFYYLSQSFSYGGTFPDGYNHYGFLEFKRIGNSGLWIQTFHPAGYSEAVFTRQRNSLGGGTLTNWVKSSN